MCIEFKLNDLWVGVFWRNAKEQLDIWICIIPCFPIHFTFKKGASAK